MNEYLLASPADEDLADDRQAPGGTMDQTSDASGASSVEVARRPAQSVATTARHTPDAAAARSWDVGGVSIRKRRWYDKFEPPQRRLLDAPCDGYIDTGDRRGRAPEAQQLPAAPAAQPAPAAEPAPVAEPAPAAEPAPTASAGPAVATPVVAVAAVSGPAIVDYVAPSSGTNGSAPAASNGHAASNGAAVAERSEPPAANGFLAPAPEAPLAPTTPVASTSNSLTVSDADDGSALRRLDGSAPDIAVAGGGAAVATLVADTDEIHSEPANMGLSESARYHNAEFEISEVETHDPVLSRTVIEWIAVVAGALIVALVIKAALFQAFYIPSPSMVPTLVEDDRVLVNKLSYRLHDIRAGDVVVFERPISERGGDESDLIKRVIGLPGDRLKAEGGKLFVDGAELDEYYLDNVTTSDFDEIEVGPDQIFVMGDNRGNSKDSRVYGPVDQELVVGRAFVKVWPISRIGLL